MRQVGGWRMPRRRGGWQWAIHIIKRRLARGRGVHKPGRRLGLAPPGPTCPRDSFGNPTRFAQPLDRSIMVPSAEDLRAQA